jgi:signal transduction histidine kinase
MEAVGVLAGGIAHDFNNLLTVINGYSELVLTALPADHPQRANLAEIRRAGERAATLTAQLLAFSRRQILLLQVVNLNTLVHETGILLRRVLGEEVEIVLRLQPDLRVVQADPGQLGQVLLNLAANARDAMPAGGSLTVETANVDLDAGCTCLVLAPGPHVMLAVSDTGIGIDAATQSRIFEPFFTTKEQGKGTGLGLSMVYGVVRQSGGDVLVCSEPGHGTTFKIFLPSAL